ncbi:rieske [2Fe-2S] domain protein [Paraburkholderia xenovorans LB400]|uniref:Vanillate demethylase n=1 Tax=Paraburkholderia xenovorans (strain LB400) TaxID=266265 RepID=Q13GA7_PARXL|nr:aromatic ring-hydroxylating dioxygenase subunit alpha [Paraburkholderia xenovorans]ABE36882.1 Vanillate demethylase [Paraburkholderia xenovorans LB400]AIP34129.1 rieske [2Fe-2S] domain protein [Paraburkholderia xenovorans LB400]
MEFLRNTWYAAGWSQDLAAGAMLGRTMLNEQLVLFRADDGTVSALSDICPHRFAPLHLGKIVDGCRIQCAYHALEFDGTGACVKNPHGKQKIPAAAKLQAYPVVEKHSLIWVWMGEQAAADPSVIPDFSMLDPDSGFQVSRRDWLHMDASYDLVVDNLMDLSHTAFLHDGILGSKYTIKADTSLEQTGETVKVTRLMPNVPVPGFFDLMFNRDGGIVDYWTEIRWNLPGCLMNNTGVTLPGAPRSEGTGVYGMHFLTPETDVSCWYHFAAVRQNPRTWGEPIDTEIKEKISDLRRYAFEEQDQWIIKAQQQTILRAKGNLQPVSLETDIGIERYKRILKAALVAERSGSTMAA